MEIQKASKAQEKSNISTAGVSQAIGSSKGVEQSLRTQQAIAGKVTGLSVDLLNSELNKKGEQDALIDAAKDTKNAEELTEAQIGFKQVEEEYIAAYGDSDGEMFNDEDDKLYKKYSAARSKRDQAATATADENLKLGGHRDTHYAKAYNQKAQAIALNKILIDLDRTSNEFAIQYEEDPVGYVEEMFIYQKTVRESLPENMHEAWNQKVQVSTNGAEAKIHSNVRKIQDAELAALSLEKMDITRNNLLDAASNDDTAGFVTAKKEYREQLDILVKSRLVDPAKADELYRSADDEATNQIIMTDFNNMLEANPDGAVAYAEYFGSHTSEQVQGLSDRQLEDRKAKKQKIPKDNQVNVLDMEYDAIQRDKMHTQMLTAISKKAAALKAGNSQSKTDNNKFVKEATEVYKSGNNFQDPTGNLTGLVPGVNVGKFEVEQMKFYQKHWADIANFKQGTVLEQDAIVKELDAKTDKQGPEVVLLEVYKDALAATRKLIAEDPGSAAQNMIPVKKEDPTFNPRDPKAFLQHVMPYTNYQNTNNNAAKHLLTTAQAEQVKALWDGLGYKDQLFYVQNIGDGPEAEMFFDQMGAVGSDMEVIYNVTSPGTIQGSAIASDILRGKEEVKAGLANFNKNDINLSFAAALNGRGQGQDVKFQASLKDATIAHAVATNPGKELTDDMIKSSLDTVYGEQTRVGGKFYSGGPNNNMVVYDKSSDQVETYIENITTDQIKKFMPDAAVFYSKDRKYPLDPETLMNDMKNNKVQFIGTGRSGEYILKRGNQMIHTETATENKQNGKTWYSTSVYKFKLWGK